MSRCRTDYSKDAFDPVQRFRDATRFTRGLLGLYARQSGIFMDRAMNLADGTILKKLPGFSGVCDFPESECCEKEPCTIIREARRGERIVDAFQIRNDGATRAFSITASPLKDLAGNEKGTVSVGAGTVTLDKGQTAAVTFSVDCSELAPNRYNAFILLKGHCDQRIKVVIHVIPAATASCTAIQKQSDLLPRHTWHDHYYCEPPQRKPSTDRPQSTLQLLS